MCGYANIRYEDENYGHTEYVCTCGHCIDEDGFLRDNLPIDDDEED